MHQELLSKKKKNVEIIHLSAQITRALMGRFVGLYNCEFWALYFISNLLWFYYAGLRYSSCKSGKDRTSMSVTLEQVQILSQEYDLAEHEFSAALDAMRR